MSAEVLPISQSLGDFNNFLCTHIQPKEGRKEGRKEGGREGRREGRKEGRKEGVLLQENKGLCVCAVWGRDELQDFDIYEISLFIYLFIRFLTFQVVLIRDLSCNN